MAQTNTNKKVNFLREQHFELNNSFTFFGFLTSVMVSEIHSKVPDICADAWLTLALPYQSWK